MKVPRHTRPNEERPLMIKNKPVFKVAPVLSNRTLSLLSSSPSTCLPSTTTTSSSSPVPSNIQSIANTMKLRMKAAVKKMVWNGKNRALLSSLVSPTINAIKPSSNIQQQQQPLTLLSTSLTSHTLLKQYLSFVQEETGALMDMESSSTSLTDCLPMPSLDHQPHPLASSGAALIESLVCSPMSKMTELYKQNDTNQKRPTSRSSSFGGGATSKMENDKPKVDASQQIKRSERLRSKQKQQQLQHKPSSRTDSTSTSIKDSEQAAAAAAAAAVIRCICDNPHEEFGSMVQCDDCSYWLHLNCLALDEDKLNDTYRCPSCYITLGPGQHTTSSAVTWRLAAQLKSKKLASRHGNSSDQHRIRKRSLGFKHKKSTLKQRLVELRQKRQQQRRFRHHSLYSTYDEEYHHHDNDDSYSSSFASNDDSESDYQQMQTWMIPKMTIDPSIKTTITTPAGNVLVQALTAKSTISLQQGNDATNEENLFESDTTETDCEVDDDYDEHDLLLQQQQYRLDYHHRNSVSSSSSSSISSVATVPSLVSSPSHASSDIDSTFEEHYGIDDLYALGTTKSDSSILLSTTASSACLDQESLLWLSRLAYLESLQSSSKQQCFTPHASDVFLCDGQQQQHQDQQTNLFVTNITTNEDHHFYTQFTTPAMTSSSRSDPPSTICSHDLSQFSFDSGPFWSPTHHQVTDSCLFL